MLKHLLILLATGISVVSWSQSSETVVDEPARVIDGEIKKPVFKARQPMEDKVETIEVSGLGQTTYTTSNTVDGSVKSFEHSLRIVVSLNTVGGKPSSCQLIFYTAGDKIQQAAASDNGQVNIFYPVSVYESIRTRLEQALTARKKVQIKVTQKTTGYREGVLMF
jgi:hypothetical protein